MVLSTHQPLNIAMQRIVNGHMSEVVVVPKTTYMSMVEFIRVMSDQMESVEPSLRESVLQFLETCEQTVRVINHP